jgi:hypothetical protein
MNRLLFFLALLVVAIGSSCDHKDVSIDLNPYNDLTFDGTFKTINSENLSGTVYLSISNGYYMCGTSLPYGMGAGKLEASSTTLNFLDTMFFPIPALYGPSYVLSGELYYKFDGKNLEIWKEKNVGSIEYDLNLIQTN